MKKSTIYLLFSLTFISICLFGLYLAIPSIAFSYEPHEADELHGLVGFIGIIILIPSIIIGGVGGWLFTQYLKFKKVSQVSKTK